jgi:FixJ family two-component response regulator
VLICAFPSASCRDRGDFGVSGQQTTVAVVDDDPDMRDAMDSLLSALGYAAELYASAEEFLNAAATTEAAFLIVDIQLGDITGVELGRQLSASGFKFPIVFMTGSCDATYWKQATELGCVAFLQKPFTGREFNKAIEAAIGQIEGC